MEEIFPSQISSDGSTDDGGEVGRCSHDELHHSHEVAALVNEVKVSDHRDDQALKGRDAETLDNARRQKCIICICAGANDGTDEAE